MGSDSDLVRIWALIRTGTRTRTRTWRGHGFGFGLDWMRAQTGLGAGSVQARTLTRTRTRTMDSADGSQYVVDRRLLLQAHWERVQDNIFRLCRGWSCSVVGARCQAAPRMSAPDAATPSPDCAYDVVLHWFGQQSSRRWRAKRYTSLVLSAISKHIYPLLHRKLDFTHIFGVKLGISYKCPMTTTQFVLAPPHEGFLNAS